MIWIARKATSRNIIEAHFVGTQTECLRFLQKHHQVPDGACLVRPDLCGIAESVESSPRASDGGQLFTSWRVNNAIQNAIRSDLVTGLPQGSLLLDPQQEQIAKSVPPLLIESRSGTGKTNVLFQHAIFYGRPQETKPALFITVSPRLRNELRQRYIELNVIENNELPPTMFFSMLELLNGLLAHNRISSAQVDSLCTFAAYSSSRSSHTRLSIEQSLIENEIGGVIMGSLASALKREPLSREEYRAEKRSNVSNKTEEGRHTRNLIYDEYERYKKWKLQNKKQDIEDIVLLLLESDLEQLFESGLWNYCWFC